VNLRRTVQSHTGGINYEYVPYYERAGNNREIAHGLPMGHTTGPGALEITKATSISVYPYAKGDHKLVFRPYWKQLNAGPKPIQLSFLTLRVFQTILGWD
jgi:hypothetical protein